MKKKNITATIIATMLLASCGTQTIIREVAATTTTTVTVAPIVDKYDEYYDTVISNSSEARSMTKSYIIQFGTLICGALDNGYSMREVSNAASEGLVTASQIEFGAAGMYYAIHILCPEYINDLSYYLNTVN